MQTPDPNEHAGRVSGMFGRIAGWYDFLNHFLSLGQDIVWRRKLVRAVRPGPTGRFLDLAAGTMDVTMELKRRHPKADVLSLDFSLPMLQKGAGKLGKNRRSVQPVMADGRSLPLPEASVDAVTIAFGIRNILPRAAAYAEILRTLAPGGRLCILEFGTSKRPIWKGLYNLYLNRLLPLAGRLVSGDAEAYRYLADTIRAFPTATELEEELRGAGFVNVTHTALMSGIVNIHVAEKRRFTGDTFVVGARTPSATAGQDTPKAPSRRPATAPAPAAAATPAPATESKTEPGADAAPAAATAADHVAAGLYGMEQAAKSAAPTSAPKSATKKKAPAKKASAKGTAKTTARKTTAKGGKTASTSTKSDAKKTGAAKKASGKTASAKTTDKAADATQDKTKKTTPKKSAVGKAAPRKASGKKSAPKKSAAGKTAKKKTAEGKGAAKQSASKKSTAKKTAGEKAAPKKKTAAKKDAKKKD